MRVRPTLQRGWTRALKEDPSWRSARDRHGAPRHRAVTALAAHAPSPVAGLSIGLPPSRPGSSGCRPCRLASDRPAAHAGMHEMPLRSLGATETFHTLE